MRIPLVDLGWQHAAIADVVVPAMTAAMTRSEFVLGPAVATFEQAFADACGVDFCCGVSSGTDAVELALRAAGVGADDEVLVPANTFIASAAAVLRAGAVPRLVDCDAQFLLMDPEHVQVAITPRTRAILAVHLFGQLAPMGPLCAIAGQHGLLVIEDAAQSHGASQDGRSMGSFGVAAATSFYPGKNLGAYGDGGAVLTMVPGIAETVRQLRDHGSTAKYHHDVVGWTARLDALQALVLSAKLPHLAAWNELRRNAAARYTAALADCPMVQTPSIAPGNDPVWHLYVIRVPQRDAVVARMQAAGIGVGIHYPIPLHQQPALRSLGYAKGDFPVAEAAADTILSLPLYPGITVAQQDVVVETLRAILAEMV